MRTLLRYAGGCLVLVALLSGLGWASAQPARQLLLGARLDFQAAVAAGAAGVAWLVVAWFCGCVLLALLARLPGVAGQGADRLAAAVTPRLVRRLVEGALGASIAMGATGQLAYAAADPPAAGHDPTGASHSAAQAPAPSPDRPDGSHDRHRPHTVVVRPGDTLWEIAAAHLPGNPGNAAIAASWPRWYAENEHTIGSDPDLILPGQRLHPPKHR